MSLTKEEIIDFENKLNNMTLQDMKNDAIMNEIIEVHILIENLFTLIKVPRKFPHLPIYHKNSKRRN
jgi:hypothetical protein